MKWIPTSERMPDEQGEYLVTVKFSFVQERAHPDRYVDVMSFASPEEGEDPCFHEWDDEYYHCFRPNVIAWADLPSAYYK